MIFFFFFFFFAILLLLLLSFLLLHNNNIVIIINYTELSLSLVVNAYKIVITLLSLQHNVMMLEPLIF